jgi:hypothetical protein
VQNEGICVRGRKTHTLYLWQKSCVATVWFSHSLWYPNTRVITTTHVVNRIFSLPLLAFILRMLCIISRSCRPVWKCYREIYRRILSAAEQKHRDKMHPLLGTFNAAFITSLQQSLAMHFTNVTTFLRLSLPWKRRNMILAEHFPFPMLINLIFISRLAVWIVEQASHPRIQWAIPLRIVQKTQIEMSFVRL